LRLSITDRCNYRCAYCLPNGCGVGAGEGELTLAEIKRLIRAFSELGFQKVRITGGEPSVRPDFLDVLRCVASTAGIGHVGLTTNGYRLNRLAKQILDAGVTALNISVDSLDASRFLQITGRSRLDNTLESVEAALALGFASVKVNTVLMRGFNSDDIGSFLRWIKNRPIELRFIELMETADNKEFFAKHHISSAVIKEALLEGGWKLKPIKSNTETVVAGPAVKYIHDDFKGTIGLIAPYSKDFCTSCNRLRVDSKARLRLCLFGDHSVSLRHLLKHDSSVEELKSLIRRLIIEKPTSHHLSEGDFGATSNLAVIGG
jgi:cyclic pyranopterin phosphate synthase